MLISRISVALADKIGLSSFVKRSASSVQVLFHAKAADLPLFMSAKAGAVSAESVSNSVCAVKMDACFLSGIFVLNSCKSLAAAASAFSSFFTSAAGFEAVSSIAKKWV